MSEVSEKNVRSPRPKQVWVLHPLLFAAYPVVFLFATNLNEGIGFSDALKPLAFSLAGTGVVLLLLRVVIGDAARAGVITSVIVVLFFSYGHALDAGFPVGNQPNLLLGIYTALATIGIYFAARSKGARGSLTSALNWIGLASLAINIIPIVRFELKPDATSAPVKSGKTTIAAGRIAFKPDIYYIVPDRYGGTKTLDEVYDYDNTPFLDELKKRGFYVAEDAKANYVRTSMSLASSLNLSHLDQEKLRSQARRGDDEAPLFAKFRDGFEVEGFLHAQGYRYYHVGSQWLGSRKNEAADVSFEYNALSEFDLLLLNSTVLRSIAETPDPRVLRHNTTLYQFEKLGEIADDPGPKFVFVHLLLPHDPYVFDSNGAYTSEEETESHSSEYNYVQHVKYANKRLLEVIDKLQDTSQDDHDPVILLQADEGPYPRALAEDLPSYRWGQASSRDVFQKFRILAAYYMPGASTEELYPDISPVNSFRVVFNAYFGTELPMLPDTHWAYEHEDDRFSFIDLTRKLEE